MNYLAHKVTQYQKLYVFTDHQHQQHSFWIREEAQRFKHQYLKKAFLEHNRKYSILTLLIPGRFVPQLLNSHTNPITIFQSTLDQNFWKKLYQDHLNSEIGKQILEDLNQSEWGPVENHFRNLDTYIRMVHLLKTSNNIFNQEGEIFFNAIDHYLSPEIMLKILNYLDFHCHMIGMNGLPNPQIKEVPFPKQPPNHNPKQSPN